MRHEAGEVALSSEQGVYSFLSEFHSRNIGILDEREQSALMALRVLIAGCGSVGGSAVEPLSRLGIGSLTLADPDRYELSNLNRQLCFRDDIGRLKVNVAAERAAAINPFVEVTQEPNGVTEHNVDALLADAGLVFDAIDSTPGSLWAKYLLHARAAERRTPVLLGIDLGGKPTVYVWDYRRDPQPFYGKVDEADFREGREVEAVRSYLGLTEIPTDFFAIIRERIGDKPAPWPQISYCATAMGALVSRIAIDLALGRHVRSVVSVDIHQLSRTPAHRARQAARWPLEAVKTLRATARGRPASFEAHAPTGAAESEPIGQNLLPVIEAIRMAPSGHNTQPWRLSVVDEQTVSIGHDSARALPVVDPESRYVSYAIGCAVESAAAIAQVEWETEPDGDPLDPDWQAGSLRVVGIDASLIRNRGLLGQRGTNRGPYHTHAPNSEAQAAIREAGSRFEACEVIPLTHRLKEVADLTFAAAAANLADLEFLEELLEWTRLDKRDRAFGEDGFTPTTLRLKPPVVALMRLLKRSEGARRLSAKLRLADLIAADARGTLRASGAAFALCSDDKSARGRVESGRALMAMWLAATRAGLALQPVNFALDAVATRGAFADLAGVGHEADLVALVRVGYARTATPSSARLPLDRLVSDQARSLTKKGV